MKMTLISLPRVHEVYWCVVAPIDAEDVVIQHEEQLQLDCVEHAQIRLWMHQDPLPLVFIGEINLGR